MKVEQQENGIALIPETDFEREALKRLRKKSIKSMQFEDAWDQKGRFLIEFDEEWGR